MQSSELNTSAFIGGLWVEVSCKFCVNNPADGSAVAWVSDGGKDEIELATAAAVKAFEEWKKTTAKERAVYLHRIKELLLKKQEQIATTITLENGKPIQEARGEVAFAASFFEWFAEEARRSYGDFIPTPVRGKVLLTVREPAGVAALITPWNFPIGMLARKVAAVLAAGCTCVIKPAEDTPLTALLFARVCEEAQLPAGVVNVVPCSRERAPDFGNFVCTDPRISVVSFTGSTETGKLLYQLCGSGIKKLSLELGGNAPFVAFDSADVQKVVQAIMASKFRNAGQTCVTANRILIQDGIYDRVIEKLLETMDRELKVGNGMDPSNNQGPIINARQHRRLVTLVKDAVEKGARILRGGSEPHPAGPLFFEPTLLVDVTPDMLVFREEIFGPVAAVLRFSSEEEAVRLANDSNRGLAGYFFSSDLNQAWRVAKNLEVGMVGINDPLVSTCEAPFGGVKMSGLGKEGSKYGLDEYTHIKYISFAGLD